jgi:hypothetical protein
MSLNAKRALEAILEARFLKLFCCSEKYGLLQRSPQVTSFFLNQVESDAQNNING